MNDLLNEANDLINSESPEKITTVHQDFTIGVSVKTSSKDSEAVRRILEEFEKKFQDYLYADKDGTLKVEFVGPDNS